ncbi:unnamed protein product [Lactuca saligna]|uniref:Oxidation resistance protein 1 n=1 Tax=Lactuca saligna TaxID=75948 RepID=A0AA35V639_LACSI|nr:unnamed protein product [Lactuca saligna]
MILWRTREIWTWQIVGLQRLSLIPWRVLHRATERLILVDGPDTSSFTAFLYLFLSPGRSENESEYSEWNDNQVVTNYRNDTSSPNISKENNGKKGLFSKGKQSLSKALSQAARFSGYRSHASGKVNTELKIDDMKETSSQFDTNDGVPVQNVIASFPSNKLPKMSEPSQLMTEIHVLIFMLHSLFSVKERNGSYYTVHGGMAYLFQPYIEEAIFALVKSTGNVLSSVVGDRKGAVFGGLVEAPLKPSTKKRYQGSNDTFVFTNTPGRPVIYRPTGVNRYFTLCSTEYLALGGGNHFALYLDSDLLNGSSLASETYGNSCLSHTQEFEVKEIELWGFVYASEYEEAISMLRTEAPGICRWFILPLILPGIKCLSLQGELFGWTCFYIGVAAVAFGCSYYHLKPNDGHLVWDRLPKP